MARILILSASAGAGHNRAAEALHESARAYCPGTETRWVDSLKYTNRLFAKAYEKSYIWMASSAPTLWGFFYKRATVSAEQKRFQKVVEMHDRHAYKKLAAHVDEFEPDALICTHFLPANALLARKTRVPVYLVVTDYEAHRLWVHRRAAGIFVATEEVRWQVGKFGYPVEQVRVTGIPIHPVFSSRQPPTTSDKPEILFMSGGFGMGQMATAVEHLLDLDLPFRLTVICGKNEKMRKRIQKLARGRAEVHGFVTNIHEFMARADLAITKSGGLTSSECLASALPIVVFSPIPGQEEANADALLERGAAVKARTPDVLDFKVRELLENPARLDMMKRAASSAARPGAGREILRCVLDENTPGG